MQLLGNRILIEFIDEPAGNRAVIIPENCKPQHSPIAIIRQLGTPRRGNALVTQASYLLPELAVGQIIRITWNCGTVPVEVGGKELHIISTLDVMAVLEPVCDAA